MAKKRIIGYKAFNRDLMCKDFKYEIGKTYEMDENKIKICESGFHFCKSIADCFNFYPPTHMAIRVCKVEALGKVIGDSDNIKFVTNKIKILSEVKNFRELTNLSPSSLGYCNIGYNNKGNWNTGNGNIGNYNTGDNNEGRRNTGDRNTGDYNSGYLNHGKYNCGDGNTGDYNSGFYNVGNLNIGNHNNGNGNVGSHNKGNWNVGHWNTCDYSSGVFNTENNEKIFMFNKPSDWTLNDWHRSRPYEVLKCCPGSPKEAQWYWDFIESYDRNAILSLPNFDAKIFKQITGIDVNEREED